MIEFVFRGYMLFGLKERLGGALSVLVQTLPYTVWHLAKSLPELLPTPIWGLVVGAHEEERRVHQLVHHERTARSSARRTPA